MPIRFSAIRDGEWTGRTRLPATWSRFKQPYAKVLVNLQAEVDRMHGRNPVIAMDIGPEHLRRDGSLYADARPATSRVLLTFERSIGGAWRELRFPCWKYLGWQENIHAIALTLEALRAVERHGAVEQDQHLRGFAALGAGDESSHRAVNTQALALSPERAARILVEAHPTMGASAGGMGIAVLAQAMLDRSASAGMLTLAQESRAAAHPDKGGADGLFATVNAAFEVLQAYHRRRE
ncbi:MAG: hypothetical protein IT355_12105 [Gemmatimonadaceae bacterium]|nr:hypothetical protein [Gemmatimonadaceae bacterium]